MEPHTTFRVGASAPRRGSTCWARRPAEAGQRRRPNTPAKQRAAAPRPCNMSITRSSALRRDEVRAHSGARQPRAAAAGHRAAIHPIQPMRTPRRRCQATRRRRTDARRRVGYWRRRSPRRCRCRWRRHAARGRDGQRACWTLGRRGCGSIASGWARERGVARARGTPVVRSGARRPVEVFGAILLRRRWRSARASSRCSRPAVRGEFAPRRPRSAGGLTAPGQHLARACSASRPPPPRQAGPVAAVVAWLAAYLARAPSARHRARATGGQRAATGGGAELVSWSTMSTWPPGEVDQRGAPVGHLG